MPEEFRWKGYLMGAVRRKDLSPERLQIHLWAQTTDRSLCGRFGWVHEAEDKNVATGWPDCNECLQEAFRRRVAA